MLNDTNYFFMMKEEGNESADDDRDEDSGWWFGTINTSTGQMNHLQTTTLLSFAINNLQPWLVDYTNDDGNKRGLFSYKDHNYEVIMVLYDVYTAQYISGIRITDHWWIFPGRPKYDESR